MRAPSVFAFVFLACSSSSSQSGNTDGGASDSFAQSDAPRVPTNHRPTPTTCDNTPPPEDCTGGCAGGCTAGKDGRCVHDSHICVCRYDECFVVSDCPTGKDCSCRTEAFGAHGSNACIPNNCDVDADCGPSGYCSPSLDTVCGVSDGIVGFYCHTPKDTCLDDSECTAAGKTGYCAWIPAKMHWECAYAVCTK